MNHVDSATSETYDESSVDDYKEINQLNKLDMKNASVLEDLLGERMTLMLYSKLPRVRSKALKDLNMGISKFDFS